MYAKRKLSYWEKRGVVSIPPHLFFGNFKDCILMKKTPADLLQDIYNKVDPDVPYVGLYIFHKPVLLLRDRTLIKQIMITDFETFPNRRFGSSNERDIIGLDSILSIRQPRWKYLRRKLTPIVTGQKLRNMMPLMLKSSQEMISFIENLSIDKTGGKTYEVRDLSSRYTANLLASIMFGVDTNSFNKHEEGFKINGKISQYTKINFFNMPNIKSSANLLFSLSCNDQKQEGYRNIIISAIINQKCKRYLKIKSFARARDVSF
jgi:cytochrome P450 family 6